MTISTDKLIDLISEKSGLDKDDIRSRLENFIKTIKQEVEAQGEYSIERLGVFKKKEGELVFEPSETLSAEINYKYSGLQPIEIMEAEQKSALRKTKETPEESFKEGKVEEGPTEQKETVASEASATLSQKRSSESEEAEEKSSEKEIETDKKTTPEPSSEEEQTKEVTDEGKKQKGEPKVAKTKSGQASKTASKSSKSSEYKDETSTGRSKKGEKETDRPVRQVGTVNKPNINRPSVQEKSRNDSVMDLVRTAGAIVLIALTVYFVYLLMGNIKPGSEEESGKGPEQAEVTQSMDSEQGATVTGEGEGTDGSEDKEAATTPKEEEKTSQNLEKEKVDKATEEIESSGLDSDFEYSDVSTSAYGLRGQPSKLGMKGYTIVIYSFSKQPNAKEIEKNLLDKGFRVIVNQANVNAENVWRVGIGQFPTIRRAQEAAKQLPEPYNEKHFLKRINN